MVIFTIVDNTVITTIHGTLARNTKVIVIILGNTVITAIVAMLAHNTQAIFKNISTKCIWFISACVLGILLWKILQLYYYYWQCLNNTLVLHKKWSKILDIRNLPNYISPMTTEWWILLDLNLRQRSTFFLFSHHRTNKKINTDL